MGLQDLCRGKDVSGFSSVQGVLTGRFGVQVMDPRYGLDMEALKLCLERCQEDDTVQNFNLQVTGGVNFSFTAQKGLDKQRTCKPTVQKSGSIQLMLVDAPRRIRLETMRFLLDHCKSAFLPLVQLNLTKRTVDKRQKVSTRNLCCQL